MLSAGPQNHKVGLRRWIMYVSDINDMERRHDYSLLTAIWD